MATRSSILALKIPWAEEPGVHGVTKSWTRLCDLARMHAWYGVQSQDSPGRVRYRDSCDFLWTGVRAHRIWNHASFLQSGSRMCVVCLHSGEKSTVLPERYYSRRMCKSIPLQPSNHSPPITVPQSQPSNHRPPIIALQPQPPPPNHNPPITVLPSQPSNHSPPITALQPQPSNHSPPTTALQPQTITQSDGK